MNVRTKGFCSALLRCGEIKLITEKREYAISCHARAHDPNTGKYP